MADLPRKSKVRPSPRPSSALGPELQRILEPLIDTVNIREHNAGTPYDLTATYRDLALLGFDVNALTHARMTGSSQPLPLGGSDSGRDVTPPSAPANLVVKENRFENILTWENPTDDDLLLVEVYHGTTGVRATAQLEATVTAPGASFTHTLEDITAEHFYWVRAVDTSGNKSVYTPNGDYPGAGYTPGVEKLLGELAGNISENQLVAELNTRLNKIEGLEQSLAAETDDLWSIIGVNPGQAVMQTGTTIGDALTLISQVDLSPDQYTVRMQEMDGEKLYATGFGLILHPSFSQFAKYEYRDTVLYKGAVYSCNRGAGLDFPKMYADHGQSLVDYYLPGNNGWDLVDSPQTAKKSEFIVQADKFMFILPPDGEDRDPDYDGIDVLNATPVFTATTDHEGNPTVGINGDLVVGGIVKSYGAFIEGVSEASSTPGGMMADLLFRAYTAEGKRWGSADGLDYGAIPMDIDGALAGNTLVVGGYLNVDLIDADTIRTRILQAGKITADEIEVGGVDIKNLAAGSGVVTYMDTYNYKSTFGTSSPLTFRAYAGIEDGEYNANKYLVQYTVVVKSENLGVGDNTDYRATLWVTGGSGPVQLNAPQNGGTPNSFFHTFVYTAEKNTHDWTVGVDAAEGRVVQATFVIWGRK